MTKKISPIVVIVFAVIISFFLTWILLISPENPKSIQYILWKSDIYRSSSRDILRAFYNDGYRGDVVLGRSELQLTQRFGRLSRPSEMPHFYKGFAQDVRWKNQKIRFITGTAWMIVFDHDKAVYLVLAKG